MSKIEVDTIDKQSGSTVTVGGSGTNVVLGTCGQTVSLGTGATQSGFGRTGTVDWVTTIQTSTPFTAVSGKGYFINTTSGAITMNLPSSPSVGDIVAIKDYAGTFATNNLTIGRGGSNMNGFAVNSIRSTDNESLTLIYADATKGWLAVEEGTGYVGESFITATGGSSIAIVGDCKIHTFTGPGIFCVSTISSCATHNIVSYTVVAGGGSGGTDVGGGGGAGGFREVKNPVSPYTASPLDGYSTPGNRITLSATAYPIVVGGGGTAPPGSPGNIKGNDGSVSTFSSITSAGGGAGGAGPAPGTEKNGNPGGSGGGGGGWNRGGGCGGPTGPGCVGAPGVGNTPPVTPAQGFNGGTVSPGGPNWPGAGGGGATAVGVNSPGSSPLTTFVAGGAGATTNITNSPVTYAAGGSGGGDQSTVPNTTVAAANSGGGGGGAGNYPSPNKGNAGGSGIVIIRYKFQ